jgi:hypothetical protein
MAVLPGFVAEAAEGDPAAAHGHALLLEQDALGEHRRHPRAQADAALRVDDAVPRQRGRTVAQRAADGARPARPAQAARDLAVGHHASARDGADQAVHALVEGHGRPDGQAGRAPVASS